MGEKASKTYEVVMESEKVLYEHRLARQFREETEHTGVAYILPWKEISQEIFSFPFPCS